MFSVIKSAYKAFFGKDESLPWRNFAQQHKGQFHFDRGEFHVTVPYKGVDIRLSSHTHYSTAGPRSYESGFTIGRVFFESLDDFKLEVTQEGWFERLRKLFGLKEVTINDWDFDEQFLIRSKDEEAVRRFFAFPGVMESMSKYPLLRLEISDQETLFDVKPPAEEHVLFVAWEGQTRETAVMDELLTVIKILVDALMQNGSIQQNR